MGNFSRDTFNKLKHYVSVRLQQGVPLVDADWNEMEDIRRYELHSFLKWFIGDGIPQDNDGFHILPTTPNSSDNFVIKGGDGTPEGAGRCLVKGWDAVNENDIKYNEQLLFDNNTLAAKWGVAPLPALTTPTNRTDMVYLDIWEREVDAVEDANLINPVIGLATCVRTKLEWVVRVAEGTTSLPSASDGHVFYPLAYLWLFEDENIWNITDLRRTGLKLSDGTINAEDIVLKDGSGSRPALRFANDPDTGLFHHGENWLYFVSGNHTPMRMKETNVDIGIPGTADKVNLSVTGNVGIGTVTPNPQMKLHVDGNIYATGAIFSNQTLADVLLVGYVEAWPYYSDILAATIYVPRTAVVNVRVNFAILTLSVPFIGDTETVYFRAVLDNTTAKIIGSYSYTRDLFGPASKTWVNIELPTSFDLTEGPHVIKIQWSATGYGSAYLETTRRMVISV